MRVDRYLAVAAVLWAVLCGTPAWAVSLRAGLMVDTGAPYTYAPDTPQASLYRSVLEQITRQSGIRFQVDYYPAPRIQQLFEVGKLDVEVGVHPSWRTLSPVGGFYTEPIGTVEYMLCFHPGQWRQVNHPADLKGWIVGTLHGQRYPEFDAAFSSGLLRRDDAMTENELISKLRLGRNNVAILDRHQAEWLSHQPADRRCEPGAGAGSSPVMLRIHPQFRQLVPVLNRAIRQLNAEGRLKAIFQRYH